MATTGSRGAARCSRQAAPRPAARSTTSASALNWAPAPMSWPTRPRARVARPPARRRAAATAPSRPSSPGPDAPSGGAHSLRAMRLIVARCEVRYSGRLSAVLPEALRLLVIKSDGSVMVHSDTGGYKPQNWMTPPTAIEFDDGPPAQIVVRKVKGEDRLDIRVAEVLSDVTH